jgi:hypothetical protein
MSSTHSYAGNGANGTSTSERIAGSVLRTLDRVATKAGGVEHDVRRESRRFARRRVSKSNEHARWSRRTSTRRSPTRARSRWSPWVSRAPPVR